MSSILENLVEKILSLIGEKLSVIEIMIDSKALAIMIGVEMNLIEHRRNLNG